MREADRRTGHGDIPMTVQAMQAGAVEFLKNCIGLGSCSRWEPNLRPRWSGWRKHLASHPQRICRNIPKYHSNPLPYSVMVTKWRPP
jgi:hypothetical protein